MHVYDVYGGSTVNRGHVYVACHTSPSKLLRRYQTSCCDLSDMHQASKYAHIVAIPDYY